MSENRINSLIIGHEGQDGILLQDQLGQEGVSWLGIDRDAIDMAGISSQAFSRPIDICNPGHVQELVRKSNPEKIYYLAAYHCSSSMRNELPAKSHLTGLAVNVQGPLNFLEAIAKYSPNSKFLYVSSSLIFAPSMSLKQRITESDQKTPMESYAFEKLLAGNYCQEFRDKYNIFASVAIPFNHESEYRSRGFFTRDVTDAIVQMHKGMREYIEVGALDTVVDWSYAGDVVNAMRCILRLKMPDDFIIASGAGHTTGEFIKIACDYVNIDFEKSIRVNHKGLIRNNSCRIGDASKLRIATGWQPTIEFSELVKQLMQAAIKRAGGGIL